MSADEDMLGWGSWAGEGVKPTRRKRTAPSSETKASSAAEAPRKKKLVVVNAQVDKKSDKYSVSEVCASTSSASLAPPKSRARLGE